MSGKPKHGYSTNRLYYKWHAMIDRCNYPKAVSYPRYGGRGITVISDWLKFNNFLKWALENGYQEGLTIERLDNNKGYSPENCTWIERSKQTMNRRCTKWITAFGETKPLSYWENDPRCKIKHNALYHRIVHLGWDHELAVTAPPIPRNQRKRKL